MPIPDYQSIMLPLLDFARDGAEHRSRAAIEALSERFRLTESEQRELLPSGKQATFDNRVGWARTYLTKAGLLESSKRGSFNITARGRQVLGNPPDAINVRYLEQFQDFKDFRELRREKNKQPETSDVGATTSSPDDRSPDDRIESIHQELRAELGAEILGAIKECSSRFFEELVIDVITAMGYGGSHKETRQAIGGSGDEGIDGIIKEDRLGLDAIFLQAKRWEGTVGRPDIQKFAGALQGQRARKGIFITTSRFTREAQEYVTHIDSTIILIDGARLVELMIDHDVGVSTEAVYQIKRIDSDYFSD